MEPKPKSPLAEKYYGQLMRQAWPEFTRQAGEQRVSLANVEYEAFNTGTPSEGDRGKLYLAVVGSPVLYRLDEASLTDPIARRDEVAKFFEAADLPKIDPPNGGFRSLFIDPRFDPATMNLVLGLLPTLRYELGPAAPAALVEWTRAEVNGQSRVRLTFGKWGEDKIRVTETFAPADLASVDRLGSKFAILWGELSIAVSRKELAGLRASPYGGGGD